MGPDPEPLTKLRKGKDFTGTRGSDGERPAGVPQSRSSVTASGGTACGISSRSTGLMHPGPGSRRRWHSAHRVQVFVCGPKARAEFPEPKGRRAAGICEADPKLPVDRGHCWLRIIAFEVQTERPGGQCLLWRGRNWQEGFTALAIATDDDIERVRIVLGGGDGFLNRTPIPVPKGAEGFAEDRYRYSDVFREEGAYPEAAYMALLGQE